MIYYIKEKSFAAKTIYINYNYIYILEIYDKLK